jgi:small conductance mechanosensitive channel
LHQIKNRKDIADFEKLLEKGIELGVVKEIEIFTTKIVSPQNKLVIIPNGILSNGNITNYNAEGILTIFHTFGVAYDAGIKQTKEVLMNAITSQEKVLKNNYTMIKMS